MRDERYADDRYLLHDDQDFEPYGLNGGLAMPGYPPHLGLQPALVADPQLVDPTHPAVRQVVLARLRRGEG